MTPEVERGCGFRKPGGVYLISFGPSVGCDRLPVPVSPCSCCGFAPRQLRSHTWIPGRWLGQHRVSVRGSQRMCPDHRPEETWGIGGRDPICVPSEEANLLMWVGRQSYTPQSFNEEASRLGVSKRIAEIPEGLVLGKTWVFLAHPDACHEPMSWAFNWLFGDGEVGTAPGIFHGMIPRRIEIILHESEATPERTQKENSRGVDVVIIPDGALDARVSWKPGEPRPDLPVAVETELPIGPQFDSEEA